MSLQDYEIIREISKTGMSFVYEALDKNLKRKVAIKKIKFPLEYIPEKKLNRIIQRFYREARAIASLNHPNIVTVHEMGEDLETGDCYMVMEFLEGKSLAHLLNENKFLSEDFVVDISIQACNAIQHIHNNGIIHRDIKPGNIFYCNDGTVMLTDFGLARVDDNQELTEEGTILGSLLYMSPEQIKNAKQVDFRTDMYSMGATMYRLLSGEFPYKAKNVPDLISQIMLTNVSSLLGHENPVSEQLNSIILKTLSKNREDRYKNMNDLKEELMLLKIRN